MVHVPVKYEQNLWTRYDHKYNLYFILFLFLINCELLNDVDSFGIWLGERTVEAEKADTADESE